jgi:hypothetical protein
MHLRLLLIAALAAVSVVPAPALAQYPNRGIQPLPPSTQVPQPPASATPEAAEAPAAAQAPAAAPAPATTTATTATTLPAIPTHNCVAPEYPGDRASNARILSFNRDYRAYGDCIKKYVDENKAWVNAVIDVNNKAVEEYNKYTLDLKKKIEAAKE